MCNLKSLSMESAMRFVLLCTLLLWITGCLRKPPTPEQLLVDTSHAFIPCIDTLAAAKYPEVLDAIPNNFAIGAFAKTFGDFFPVAKRELDRGRKYIRVNLLWSDTHSYGDNDIPFIRAEAKRYQILCTAFPNATIELAPFTEHNLSNPTKYLSIVKAAAPSCGVVNSVWKGKLTKKYKNEVHGNHPKPNSRYNYSFDGTNSVDANFVKVQKQYSDSEIFCAWHPRLNGKWNMVDDTPRPLRNAWPSFEMLRSLVYLFTVKGETFLPSNWLAKSHADRHSAEDLKGDKLLIISPIKADSVVLRRDGERITGLPYYGPFSGGGHRYYSSLMGYKIGPNLDVFIGTKKYGKINAGFRDPTFR